MLERIRDYLSDGVWVFTVICVLELIAIGVMACVIVNDGDDDSKPDWADDMAGKLSDKGGRINVYRSWGDSNFGYDYQIMITAGQKVYADSHGLVVKSNNSVTVYQYERIAGIYINS